MSIKTEALALVPGYVDSDGDAQRIATLRKGLNSREFGRGLFEAQQRYENAIATSHDIIAVRDAFVALESAKILEAAFADIGTRLRELGSAQRQANKSFPEAELAPALQFLDRRLGELMARVRESDSILGPIRSVEAALRGSDAVIAAWRDLTDAVDEYEEIRRVQNTLTVTMFDGADRMLSEALWESGRIRDAFNHDAPWVRERHRSRRGRLTVTTANSSFLDWVSLDEFPAWEREPMDIWPADDRPGYLRWMATVAHPWVPTHDELNTAHEAAQRLAGPVSAWDDLARALDAYDAYYTRRGIQPVRALDVASIRSSMERPKVSAR